MNNTTSGSPIYSEPLLEATPVHRGFTKALLWKNVIIKKRHPIKWALEVLLPVSLILLLGILKTLTDDVVVPDGWSNDEVSHEKNGTSFSLFATDKTGLKQPKFYQTESTVSGL
ncbi:hypothetical protein As57867_013013, partial [Aphanomyces stellatus]